MDFLQIQFYSPRFNNRKRNIFKAVKTYKLAPQPGFKVLDAGCGEGSLMYFFEKSGYVVEGFDIDKPSLEIARKYLKSKVWHDNLVDLKISNCYDLIVCGEVLEHIEDDVSAMKKLYTALKPNGHLIVTVPNDPKQWNADDEVEGHVRRYAKKEMAEKLSNAGFEVIEVRFLGFPMINLFIKFYLASGMKLPGHNIPNFTLAKKIQLKVFNFLERADDFFNVSKADKLMVIARKKAKDDPEGNVP